MGPIAGIGGFWSRWALHKKSWAVIDRPYSLGCATVGALYERPRCIFCAKPLGGGFADREARARAKPKRDSAQPQEIGRSRKRSPSRRRRSQRKPPRPGLRSGSPPNLGGELRY